MTPEYSEALHDQTKSTLQGTNPVIGIFKKSMKQFFFELVTGKEEEVVVYTMKSGQLNYTIVCS